MESNCTLLPPTSELPPASIYIHFKELLRRSKQQITDVVKCKTARSIYCTVCLLLLNPISLYSMPETFIAPLQKSVGVLLGLSSSSICNYIAESRMKKWYSQLLMDSDIKSCTSLKSARTYSGAGHFSF